MASELQFAVYVPESLLAEIDAYATQHNSKCTIERKESLLSKSQSPEDLRFDPITSSLFTWAVLKFVGDAALNVALGLLASAIYDKLKERSKQKGRYEIRMRFPSGETFTIESDKPLDIKSIEELMNRSKLK